MGHPRIACVAALVCICAAAFAQQVPAPEAEPENPVLSQWPSETQRTLLIPGSEIEGGAEHRNVGCEGIVSSAEDAAFANHPGTNGERHPDEAG